jgi:hypothetical protein
MTRSLSTPTAAATAADVTLPGYLVEIDFATPVYLSSRNTLPWNGQTWVAWDIAVDQLGTDGTTASQTGSLTLGNTDYTLGAMVLGEGAAGRPVHVWKFYGTAPALADPVLMFYGVADQATIDPDRGTVSITLQQEGGITQFCPRTYINQASGFNHIPPSGTVIHWNGDTFTLTAEV